MNKAKLLLLAFLIPGSLFSALPLAAQAGFEPTTAAPVPWLPGSLAPGTPTQSLFLGSVPSGKATPGVVKLSLQKAIELGLRYNLAILIGEQQTRAARGARWKALSELLPKLSAQSTETIQQTNLRAFGFPGFPGLPTIVGPFSVFDLRAFLTQPVLNFKGLASAKAATENVRAAEYSYRDARELIVLAVANAYLEVLADEARVDATQSQVKTAQSLYEKAQDLHRAGLAPKIDVLRAQVEFQMRQQQLLTAQNQHDTQKLALARAIGLPLNQNFELANKIPYAPLLPIPLDEALTRAFTRRADYQSALARLRAAEETRKAALRERWPTLDFSANYGDIGIAPGVSHGTFMVAGNLTIPIFQGGRVQGDVLQADAALRERQSELANLRGLIEQQVRTALLDLGNASNQVRVAKSSLALARETLEQAEDRFAAGVVDNLEVVQAQETVASANENYIASLYTYNLVKAALARAMGMVESSALQFLGGQ